MGGFPGTLNISFVQLHIWARLSLRLDCVIFDGLDPVYRIICRPILMFICMNGNTGDKIHTSNVKIFSPLDAHDRPSNKVLNGIEVMCFALLLCLFVKYPNQHRIYWTITLIDVYDT